MSAKSRNSKDATCALLTNLQQDHGGGIDAARRKYGGARIAWADLSTGINPCPYPLSKISENSWAALPDSDANGALEAAARKHWNIPDNASVLAANGVSVLIAQIPYLAQTATVSIPQPTYNEHAAAFETGGWQVTEASDAQAQVVVNPNNPDGRIWTKNRLPSPNARLTVIDESFCDVAPDATLVELASQPGVIVLKSFGKFWGLAGLRLGFAIGDPSLVQIMRARLGPWSVAGPALVIGTRALQDTDWADSARIRLKQDSARLDVLLCSHGAKVVGGTSLFRLYLVEDAEVWQQRLARHRIWSRIFPYNPGWLRLGVPHPLHWPRLEAALRA